MTTHMKKGKNVLDILLRKYKDKDRVNIWVKKKVSQLKWKDWFVVVVGMNYNSYKK
jgi:ribosomal protein L21E